MKTIIESKVIKNKIDGSIKTIINRNSIKNVINNNLIKSTIEKKVIKTIVGIQGPPGINVGSGELIFNRYDENDKLLVNGPVVVTDLNVDAVRLSDV